MLFYGHYDVQPVDPLNLWNSPPFEATVRDGELFARGASDDKGQVFMHFKAIEAHLKQNGRLPINFKLILEGEEEVGSKNLDPFIESQKDLLKADVVLISDTSMFDRGVPSLCYGLRGLAYFQIDVRGTNTDLHSGTYGGGVANPAIVLAQMLAQMKDRSGRVKIPGFYDDGAPAERRRARRVQEAAVQREALRQGNRRAEALSARPATRTLERTTGRPTFEVNGLLSGFTGEGAKTVLPAVAMAKVSMRLVPDQDPHKIGELFEAYVKKIAPRTVQVEVTAMHGGWPWMASLDNPFVQAAGRAIERGFGQAPVYTREGGSIPVVATFQRVLGIPSVLFGVGLPDDRIHAPNEKLDLANFYSGIISSAFLYEEFAK